MPFDLGHKSQLKIGNKEIRERKLLLEIGKL
jgi:hypothetical protein